MPVKLFNKRGDTLVEVTVALAILGTTIISAYGLMNRAIQLNQTAKERVELVTAAMQQAEALEYYRDNKSWTVFTAGFGTLSTFHMVKSGSPVTWAPVTGDLNDATDTSLPPGYAIRVTPSQDSSGPNMYNFKITYTAPSASGSVANSSDIYLKLTNLDPLK